MAYFNNLLVGGTAKFLQDIEVAGVETTKEELNYLHTEKEIIDGWEIPQFPQYIMGDICAEDGVLGLKANNKYTIICTFKNGEVVQEEVVAISEGENTGMVALLTDGIYVMDAAEYNPQEEEFISGNRHFFICPSFGNPEISSVVIKGLKADGTPLQSIKYKYNTVPVENLFAPIEQIIEFPFSYPYSVTISDKPSFYYGELNLCKVTSIPYDDTFIIQPLGSAATLYCTSNSDWMPEEGQWLQIIKDTSSTSETAYKVGIFNGYSYSSIYMTKKPEGYNRVSFEIFGYGLEDGSEIDTSATELSTRNFGFVLGSDTRLSNFTKFFDDNTYTDGYGGGEMYLSNTEGIYSYSVGIQGEVKFNKNTISINGIQGAEVVDTVGNVETDVSNQGNFFSRVRLNPDAYEYDFQNNVPIYLGIAFPQMPYNNAKITWYKD